MRLISSSALLALRLRVQTCKYHAFFFGLLRKFGFRISTGEIEMDGIGKRTKVDLEVKWPQPSGSVERFSNLPLDRYITIVEETGKWK